MYYLIMDTDKRCYGVSDVEPAPMDGFTIFKVDKTVSNPHDYVLRDGALVYDPPKEVEA